MIKLAKTYFMPVMVLLVIFLSEICSCTQILTGITDESTVEHVWAIILASITYTMLSVDLMNGKLTKRDKQVLLFLLVTLVLYYLTSFFYSKIHPRHFSYLLVYISESIPAAYIGMRFARSGYFDKVNNLLPFFIIPMALLIGSIGIRYASMGERVENDDSGLNYQTLSYYMAFSYSYSAYYVFLKQQSKGLFMAVSRVMMLFIMLYCGMVCLVSGGRGAFVFIIFISMIFSCIYLRNSRNHRIRKVTVLILIGAIVFWLINHFDVMESAGMQRVMDRLTEDSQREMLYHRAYETFMMSPILGNGVGSVWWTVGFYSHNMILDFLSEVGLFGTVIVIIILAKTAQKLYTLSKMDYLFLFFLIVMIGALVRLMFSSYWVSSIKLFFVCSLTYCLPVLKSKR